MKKKTIILFLKRVVKYVVLLAVLIAMVLPLYIESYQLAKKMVMEQSKVKLEEGIEALEEQVMRIHEISSLLKQEETFTRLFFLQGKPSPENYLDFNQLHTKIRSLALTQELVSNMYIVFKNNPLFISNYISSDNYEDVYNAYYHYKDIDYTEWHSILFGEPFTTKIMHSSGIYSSYYSKDYFEGITFLVNHSYYTAFEQLSVLVVDIAMNEIVDRILYEDQLTNHVVDVIDNEGNTLLAYNQELADEEAFIRIAQTSQLLGLEITIGIPTSVFDKNVNSLLEIIVVYIVIGIFTIIVLLALFSLRETMWLNKILEAVSKRASNKESSSNEYKYIKNVVQKMNIMHEKQIEEIEELHLSIKNSVLKHLIMVGVHTDQEKTEVESYFGTLFHNFCVVKVNYRWELEEETDPLLLAKMDIEMDKRCESMAIKEIASYQTHLHEKVYLLFWPYDEEDRIPLLKEKMQQMIRSLVKVTVPTPIINMGVSAPHHSYTDAKTAYQQAAYIMSIHHNDISGGVYVFDQSVEEMNKPIFDIAIVLKLYDAIIAGEVEIISQIFDSSRSYITMHALTIQEQLQVFFSFRQIVSNAYYVINSKQTEEKQLSITIPEYAEMGEVIAKFDQLKVITMELCNVVLTNKKSNNTKLKEDIILYIEKQFTDPMISASCIANDLLISEKYVFSFIKEQTGKSLGKYIEELRLAKAEELLLETEYPNSRILKMCGFGSENTFYRTFAKKHLVSPTVWRSNRRNDGNITMK